MLLTFQLYCAPLFNRTTCSLSYRETLHGAVGEMKEDGLGGQGRGEQRQGKKQYMHSGTNWFGRVG